MPRREPNTVTCRGGTEQCRAPARRNLARWDTRAAPVETDSMDHAAQTSARYSETGVETSGLAVYGEHEHNGAAALPWPAAAGFLPPSEEHHPAFPLATIHHTRKQDFLPHCERPIPATEDAGHGRERRITVGKRPAQRGSGLFLAHDTARPRRSGRFPDDRCPTFPPKRPNRVEVVSSPLRRRRWPVHRPYGPAAADVSNCGHAVLPESAVASATELADQVFSRRPATHHPRNL